MRALDEFLHSVQRKAFISARLATGNEDEAMDLVQDSMFKLVKHYADSPAEDWPKLFQRILQNAIKDWYRRQKVRRILYWWQQQDQTEEQLNVTEDALPADSVPQHRQNEQLNGQIYQALQQLPQRQQQAFLLRAWWEHSTEDTAQIMGCSTGSVKTSYSRARNALANLLGDTLSD